jgi:TonB family protein
MARAIPVDIAFEATHYFLAGSSSWTNYCEAACADLRRDESRKVEMKAAQISFRVLGLAAILAFGTGSAVLAGDAPTISTSNAMGRATKKVTPEFPMTAKQLHITGAQEVEVTVSKAGDVTEAKVLRGNAMFSNSSLAAAKQWKFSPLVKDGAASEFTTILIFNFGQ